MEFQISATWFRPDHHLGQGHRPSSHRWRALLLSWLFVRLFEPFWQPVFGRPPALVLECTLDHISVFSYEVAVVNGAY